MNEEKEIISLRKEVEKLRAEIYDVREALKMESTNATEHFDKVYGHITDIHEYLRPLLHKVFPDYTAAKKQLDAFLAQYGGRSKKSPKSR